MPFGINKLTPYDNFLYDRLGGVIFGIAAWFAVILFMLEGCHSKAVKSALNLLTDDYTQFLLKKCKILETMQETMWL